MLFLRAVLLGSVVAVHVLGAVGLYRRYFPRESVWFGFIVPPLALIMGLNCLEHVVALHSLVGLLPFTTAAAAWGLWQLRRHWRHVRLPVGVFLVAFAFALTLRALRPDIVPRRDGTLDLSLMVSYCMGQKVPPPLIFYPSSPLAHYYAFGHYGASVLTRLFALDPGTGYNLVTALLSALVCVLAAGVAWRVSGQKTGVTILTTFLVACGNTGASAYLALTTTHLNPNDAEVGMYNELEDHNPLWQCLHAMPWYDRPELIAPGAWNWIGDLHSAASGLILILLMALSLVELLRRRRVNWPWICLGAVPFLTVLSCTWGVVLEVPILLGTLLDLAEKFLPRDWRLVLLGLGATVLLLLPAVLDFLGPTAYPGSEWENAQQRTPLVLFAVLWWPIFLPWLALLTIWPRLSPAMKMLAVVLPLFLLGMDFYAVGIRLDWTSKLWGYVYALAWVVFFPRICVERASRFRVLVALLVGSGVISLASWTGHAIRRINWTTGEILHLEGTSKIALSPLRGPILPLLSQLKGQTIIPGKSDWLEVESQALAAFTENDSYVSWSYFADVLAGGNAHAGAKARETEVNALYEGKCADPLGFLRAHQIAALVIYPDDNIAASVVERLKAELAPGYAYHDFSDGVTQSGVFVLRKR